MAEARMKAGHVLAWAAAGLLVVLLFLSFTGNGTFMGGVGMGGVMAVPVLLVLAAVFLAYRYGRLDEKAQQLQRERKD